MFKLELSFGGTSLEAGLKTGQAPCSGLMWIPRSEKMVCPGMHQPGPGTALSAASDHPFQDVPRSRSQRGVHVRAVTGTHLPHPPIQARLLESEPWPSLALRDS